jgi:hypothetical protein
MSSHIKNKFPIQNSSKLFSAVLEFFLDGRKERIRRDGNAPEMNGRPPAQKYPILFNFIA